MTGTPKIDTQAPDTSREAVERLIRRLGHHRAHKATGAMLPHNRDGADAAEILRALLAERDLSAAREAAAWIAGRDAAVKVAQDKHDAAAKWAAHYLEEFDGQTDSLLIAQEIRALPLPDTTALDRLIAERVREAVEAEREVCAKAAVAKYADGGCGCEDPMESASTIRARDSKENPA